MARKTIETLLDRKQLLNMNDNFEELYTNVNNIKDKSNEIDNLKNELKDTIQKVEDTEIKDNSIDGSKIIDSSIEANKLAIFETNETSNLLDLTRIKKDTSLNPDGSIKSEQRYWLTDLIPFDASKNERLNITYGSYRIFTYDEDGNYIGPRAITQGDSLTIEPISKTKYIRISGTKDLSEVMINKGDTLLPYEEFGYTFSSDIVPKQGGSETVVQGGTIVDLENSKQISNEVSEVYLSNEKRNIYSTTKTSQLDYVEISTNSVDAEIILSYSDEGNNTVLANTSVPGELEELPLTLQNIVEYGYPNVEYLYYDPKKASYKIALKNLNFSNGFELSVRNSGASTINITTKIVGRYYV